MPTSLLICKSCGNRQTFFLDGSTVEEMGNGTTASKHCLRCRATTDWTFQMIDRRTGRDRRNASDDRRADERSTI
jgi:hypothetical protein